MLLRKLESVLLPPIILSAFIAKDRGYRVLLMNARMAHRLLLFPVIFMLCGIFVWQPFAASYSSLPQTQKMWCPGFICNSGVKIWDYAVWPGVWSDRPACHHSSSLDRSPHPLLENQDWDSSDCPWYFIAQDVCQILVESVCGNWLYSTKINGRQSIYTKGAYGQPSSQLLKSSYLLPHLWQILKLFLFSTSWIIRTNLIAIWYADRQHLFLKKKGEVSYLLKVCICGTVVIRADDGRLVKEGCHS